MAKTKYQFNPESISYEEVEVSFKTRALGFLKHIASSLVLAVIMVVILFNYFGSPKERSLERENQKILSNYERLNNDI